MNATMEAAFLRTRCKREQNEIHALGNREVVEYFDGGDITSHAGGLLLREVEQRTRILQNLRGVSDYREGRFTEFTVNDDFEVGI